MDILIVNPLAGNGKSLKLLEELKTIYRGLDYQVIVPRDECQAFDVARYYANCDFVRQVLAVGGDGTCNRVVNGMIGSKKPLIVIPAGTNNNFYRALSEYDDDFYADLGKVNEEYFVSNLSIGLPVQLLSNVHDLQIVKNKEKNLKIIWDTLKEYNGFPIDFTIGKFQYLQKTIMLTFCNSPYYGKLELCDDASLRDGRLNAIVVDNVVFNRRLLLLLKLLLQTHYYDRSVVFYESDKAHVEFSCDMPYSLDGEMRSAKTLDVSCEKAKVLIKRTVDSKIDLLCNRK